MEITPAEWTTRFKNRVSEFGLRKQTGEITENPKCASFELGPRPSFAHNLFIECRWEMQSADVCFESLEKSVARIVIQLKKHFHNHTKYFADIVEPHAPKEVGVRVGQSGGTVYITRPELPELVLSVPPSSQIEAVEEYGRACALLQDFWRKKRADITSEFTRLVTASDR